MSYTELPACGGGGVSTEGAFFKNRNGTTTAVNIYHTAASIKLSMSRIRPAVESMGTMSVRRY